LGRVDGANRPKVPDDLAFELAFGSACPGKHFGVRSLLLNIACTLAVFDVEAPAGQKLETKFEKGLVW